ncbi:DUF4249 domain-containing protein [bacterium SCSIO 12643]|nr:DUF4249 domain-containing protein [bacterium SCSIO 12643]
MKLKLYIILLFAIVTITSCNETIDLKLDDPKPVLVVDGYLSNLNTMQYVRLSNLENYFSNQVPDYSVHQNAKVILLEDGTEAGTYSFNQVDKRFELQYKGIEGKDYQIDITLSDGSRYISASEIMETPVPIDTIWYEYNESPGGPGPQGGEILVKINTQEPAGAGDNYQWKSYVNDYYQFESDDLFFADDRFVDGQDVTDLDVFGMSEDQYVNYKASSPTNQVFVTIEQLKISARYLKYLTLIQQQLFGAGSPFASPPAEIRGNVYKQGEDEVLALGFFYTAGIDSKTIEIVE